MGTGARPNVEVVPKVVQEQFQNYTGRLVLINEWTTGIRRRKACAKPESGLVSTSLPGLSIGNRREQD